MQNVKSVLEKLAAQQAYERIRDKFDGIEEMSEWDLSGNELMLLARHGMREEEGNTIKNDNSNRNI